MSLASRSAAALAAVLALPAAALAGPPLSAIYQSAAFISGGCAGSLCTAAFATVPAGKYLRVDHYSCVLTVDPGRSVLNMSVQWGAGGVANSIYQRPELVGRDGSKSFWYVRGNDGFVIPPGVTPRVTYYAPGSGSTWPTCDISGELVTAEP